MKRLLFTALLFTFISSTQAKIYDSFMCYTHVDTVVLFGILKEEPTLRINYYRLDKNPTTIELKVSDYSRNSRTISATGLYKGKEVIKINSRNGRGLADINLMPFPGSEDVSFAQEEVLCYFGKFED